MQASYTKLRSGDWGIRVEGRATTGQSVTVTKRDGSRQTVCVDRVVWSGEGVSLCSIRRETAGGYSAQRATAGGTSGRCRECRGPIRGTPEHRAMAGLCGSCAFDEYDC